MDKNLKELCSQLEETITEAYQNGTTPENTEKNAALFLTGQLRISAALRDADLEARMKKSGLKTIKAAIYLEEVRKSDKKPSDTMLEQIINVNELVQSSQMQLDEAEVEKLELERLYDVFCNAHIYFRSLSKRDL